MSKFDYSQLDGRLLQMLLAIIEEGSVTAAAERLGVTQSAVSHLLGKLREIVGDPLFVKSGRGIVPTVRAQAMAIDARLLLEDMRRFVQGAHFDPAREDRCLTIAANDFQRDLLLPALLQRLQAQAPRLRLKIISSDVPRTEMLREGRCSLIISPRPPDASDILHKRLFEDHYRVFYDPCQRQAPLSVEQYLAADHISVCYQSGQQLYIDSSLAEQGVERRFAVFVPGFAGIPAFLQGSTRLATVPSLLGGGLLRGFATCALPLPAPAMPMFMIWHLRERHDPLHTWLRQELETCVATCLSRQP